MGYNEIFPTSNSKEVDCHQHCKEASEFHRHQSGVVVILDCNWAHVVYRGRVVVIVETIYPQPTRHTSRYQSDPIMEEHESYNQDYERVVFQPMLAVGEAKIVGSGTEHILACNHQKCYLALIIVSQAKNVRDVC